MNQEEKERLYKEAEKLLSEQDFVRAAIYGAAAMILAAGLYGAIGSGGSTVGFMAAGIGIAIGFTMRVIGKGIESKFAVVASLYAVAGCLLGNLFAIVIYVARVNAVSPFAVLFGTPPSELLNWIVTDLQFADLIFWLLAIGAAGYFVNRRLSRQERLAIGMYDLRRQ